MSRELQLGIDFLVKLDLTDSERRALPDVPDYEDLARRARRRGFAVSASGLQEAFRLLMLARLVGLQSHD
ncbi:MAG: hypothetical protein GW859_03575 [Sphingomonadales bacterium]|nr:hypothetical protein [Sphingomonadales bacterium]